MSFVAIHRTTRTSLATDKPWLGPDEWSACSSAADLLDHLHQLHASQSTRLANAIVEGRSAGFAAGHDKALRETSATLASSWQKAADAARLEAREIREAIVALSVQVVQRIATDLASADVVSALARRASEELLPDQPAVVRVHPDVAAAVRDHLADTPQLEVREDLSLCALDCVFDTPTGQLLAGLQTQLARVAKSLNARESKVAT
ncbi:MAG: hypothetical protein JF606_09875 [Burkholderiales bacterium]|jgi:type III secretion protein L|nr:hypothetical protein [Burkholderiales bacterium]